MKEFLPQVPNNPIMQRTELYWLPSEPSWGDAMIATSPTEADEAWWSSVALTNFRLDGLETMRLDRRRAKELPTPPPGFAISPVRLAVLGSLTIDNLLPAIGVARLRRGIWIDTFTSDYQQHAQGLMDPASALHRFHPGAALFALDAPHLLQGLSVDADAWLESRATAVGGNEHRLHCSRPMASRWLSATLREQSDAANVDIISHDDRAATDGLVAWHDPALWHRAKHEIHPGATPLYGDLVGRLIAAAARGGSYKCMVLDLDNTLWGGDDGLSGIQLGQGRAAGKAFVAFQHYALDLGRRGIILAVCSRNDETNALEPFEHHPEMVLRRDDITCFVGNWTDKAANLRHIARRLNIDLDSFVFADGNPAELAIVRRELPMVALPDELPDEPALYGACLVDVGYFEARQITREDLARTEQYQANQRREAHATSATDLPGYLRSLPMRFGLGRFDKVNQSCIVHLINKTIQFNLTTVRVSNEDVTDLIADISILAGRPGADAIRLDFWLMSCLLGRGVDEESLNLAAHEGQGLDVRRLIGHYRPTAKDGMAREHYARLGFILTSEHDGTTGRTLPLDGWTPRPTYGPRAYAGMASAHSG